MLERAKQALTVPESCVEFSGDSAFVYVLTDSVPTQQYQRRLIKTGLSNGLKIAVKEGIGANESIRGAEKKQ